MVERYYEGKLNQYNSLNLYSIETPPLIPGTFTYVQGMNVLAAPFLHLFWDDNRARGTGLRLFRMFIENICPRYVQPSLDGVHVAVKV